MQSLAFIIIRARRYSLFPHLIGAENIGKPRVEKDIDIDIPSHKREIAFSCLERYYKSIGGNVVRIGTFGTETSKSAVITSCRGLGINNDVGLYLSSLIPIERGKVRCIEDCYYGNESKGIAPVYEFRNVIDEYEGLLDVVLGIQGLINKRGTHPCGAVCVNYEISDRIPLMRAPSGELITQFDLEDSEYVGGLKYDFLNTRTCSMIQVNLEMLLKYNVIEQQETLRKTYDKYLHPDVIDRTTEKMWEKLHNKELISAFQFDSNVGEQAINLIKPSSLAEATSGNNLMRLMVEDGEQPLDMYIRYKNDIQEWYKDMRKFGLNEDEICLLEKYLKIDYGVCSTQEGMMMMSMDDNIAGFTVVEANTLRKAVAKKKGDIYDKAHKLFYEKGLKRGTRKVLLDYVWDVQIALQKGYSFSLLHSVAYSYILIQQLNLIYHYNPIYWNTSVLLIESGALENEVLDKAEDDEEESHGKEKTTNYGTVAKAIGNLQDKGVKIALPNINKAEMGFSPDVENDQIIFGLKGIMKINNKTARLIEELRPFHSIEDVITRMVDRKQEVILSTGKKQNKSLLSNQQMIMLIKSGALDSISGGLDRREVLENFLLKLNPHKTSITGKQIEKVIQLGIVPENYKLEVRIYRFRNYIMNYCVVQRTEGKSIKWYNIEEDYAIEFFNEHFINEMQEDRDYVLEMDGSISIALGTSRKGSFDATYKNKISDFTKWLSSAECIDLYNTITFNDVKKNEMSGNESSWEMESLNYYYGEHELVNVDREFYDISKFEELSEEPTVVGHTKYAGKQYPKFALTRIVGTVLDRDKNKHVVALLTPDGVVKIKFQQGQFAFYDKTLSIANEETGKKTTIEKSWFSRGNKLLVTGFRREEMFIPKRYKNSVYQHTVCKIQDIEEDGRLILQSERANVD